MKKCDLVSIVVPCYNVKRYFKRCIESLIRQTYKNIEIILVDDGSTDGTGVLIEQYSNIDPRLVAIRQDNAGLSAARNSGLRIAKGEYICFVDSDDYVAPNYVEKMFETIKATGSEICACNYYYLYENEKSKRFLDGKCDHVYSTQDGLKDLFSGKQITGVVTWNKLYKTSLFRDNNITFPVGKINEDNFTTYKLYYFANKICYTSECLYYYLQRNDSIMGRGFDVRRMDILEAYKETEKFLKEHKIDGEMNDYLVCYNAMIHVNLYNKIVRSDYNGDEKDSIRSSILKNKRKYLGNKVISVKIKVMILILGVARRFYDALIRIIN